MVRWLAAQDIQRRLVFATLQGETARIRGLDMYADMSGSLVVVRDGEGGRVSLRSDACVELALALGGVWRLFRLARVLPCSLRDGIYRLVACNRHAWGKNTHVCDMPEPAFRERLLP